MFTRDLLPLTRGIAALYKPTQKKIGLSSELNRAIIERRASDIAELEHISVSAVFEDALVRSLLTSDETARPFVNGVLWGHRLRDGAKEPYGVLDAIAEILTAAAYGGEGDKPRRGNTWPLVEFAAQLLSVRNPVIEWNCEEARLLEEELNRLWQHLESLAVDLARRGSTSGRAERLSKVAGWVRERIIPDVEARALRPSQLKPSLPWAWDALNESAHGLQSLSLMLSALERTPDSAEDRSRLQALCEQVLGAWTAEDNRQRRLEVRAKEESGLVSRPIADGAIAMLPRSWVEINPEDAPFAEHVGVIATRNGTRRLIDDEGRETVQIVPHFVFYLRHLNVREMNEENMESLLARARKMWPDLTEVEAAQVKIRRNPDGGIANYEEWAAAPEIGWFEILPDDLTPGMEQPLGARIIKPNGEKRRGE